MIQQSKSSFILGAIALLFLVLVAFLAVAQEPINTTNETAQTNTTNTTEPVIEPTKESDSSNQSNATTEPKTQIMEISIVDFFPKKFELGNVQLNILVKNTGNTVLQNIGGIITGEGISTYDIVPIDSLKPSEKNYILFFINTKKSGEIPVVIKILNKVYKTKLTITDPQSVQDAQQKQLEEERIRNRTIQLGDILTNLTKELDALEEQYYLKKGQDYDLHITPDDAKTYLRNAQASFAKRDLDGTEANIVLLQSELSDLKKSMANATQLKLSISERLKDNVPWITALLTGVIAIITITERFKKKSEVLTDKLHKAQAELRKQEKKKKRKRKK